MNIREYRYLKIDKTGFIFDIFAWRVKQVSSFFFIFASLCSVKLGCIREKTKINFDFPLICTIFAVRNF